MRDGQTERKSVCDIATTQIHVTCDKHCWHGVSAWYRHEESESDEEGIFLVCRVYRRVINVSRPNVA
jgi:hypothetical protein